jgi:hypothetical protein
MTFSMDNTGFSKNGAASFILKTKGNMFVGGVMVRADGKARVYFDCDFKRKSAIVFESLNAALEYMGKRCAKQGWN